MENPVEFAGMTVLQLLHYRARHHPSRLAISAPSASGSRGRLSYLQLVIRMEEMARGLAGCGVLRDDRVMLLLDNDAALEGVLTATGCYALGAAIVPANTRLGDEELLHACALIEPALIIARGTDAVRARNLWPSIKVLEPGGLGADAWPDPETIRSPELAAAELNTETLTALLFTSGTTSRSKAVMHCHRSQIATGHAVAGALGLRAGDIY